MFTGIVTQTGQIVELAAKEQGFRLVVQCPDLPQEQVEIGDSISVNGVCLTVVEFSAERFSVDVSGETVACTTVGAWKVGQLVNLELALGFGARVGGHLVSGHVDGLAEIKQCLDVGEDNVSFSVGIPDGLAPFVAVKGSVCLDGVSLTVNRIEGDVFEVSCVPHTLACTILKDWSVGTLVNFEVDLVARYLARFVECRQSGGVIDEAMLKQYGWLA